MSLTVMPTCWTPEIRTLTALPFSGSRGLGRREHEVVAHRVEGHVHLLAVRGRAPLVANERGDQGILHPEDRVRVEVLVPLGEDVSDEGSVTGAWTMNWTWAGRIGLRFAASRRSPTGPSWGMGYGSGFTNQNQ